MRSVSVFCYYCCYYQTIVILAGIAVATSTIVVSVMRMVTISMAIVITIWEYCLYLLLP